MVVILHQEYNMIITRLINLIFLLIFCTNSFSQDLWNRKIDDAQKVLCKKDNNNECTIEVSNNKDINLIANAFIIDKVDQWQNFIVAQKDFSNNDKIKFLRILYSYITEFNKETKNRSRNKDYSASLSKELFSDFDKTIEVHQQKLMLNELIAPKGILASKIITYTEYTKETKGYKEALEEIDYKECLIRPKNILSILNKRPNLKNADSLIVIAAYNDQDKLYDFAQCVKCPVSDVIKRSQNGLIKTIYAMSQMETGRSLTPFLDIISRNEISIDSINKLQKNINSYYTLLVNTRINYSKRVYNGEEILALTNFNNKIKEVALEYVKEINELHTKPDNIRFASLNSLSDKELYYLATYGIDELYTSSFNRGVFAQLVSKLNGKTSSKLLEEVNNDYFRKFIKISAGYNKLSQFLKLMPDSNAKVLMNNFIANLTSNDNIDDIEDAVDVADAYVGIGTNVELKKVSDQMVEKIKTYEAENKSDNNLKGETIYRLLHQIFTAFTDTTKNLAVQLGIPPVTKIENKNLLDNKGRTIVKLYFYGDEDKDGQLSFQSFMGLFGDKTRWKVEGQKNPHFVTITSLKGKPIQIFANRALYDPTKKTDPDDTAKLRMSEFMLKQGLQPNFVMHRGHSYHVPITLNYMEKYDTSAKMIVLGSCGGYQNLQSVLNICPESQIVSSKQTGTMYVNEPLLRILFDDLSQGKDIVWPTIWPRVRNIVAKDKLEMFEEYIPPHKNLGMIFIKAYKKQMGL